MSVLFVLYLKYHTLYLLFIYVYVGQIQITGTPVAAGVRADADVCGAGITGAEKTECRKC